MSTNPVLHKMARWAAEMDLGLLRTPRHLSVAFKAELVWLSACSLSCALCIKCFHPSVRLSHMQVVCVRDTMGRTCLQRSMLLSVQLPLVPNGWFGAPSLTPPISEPAQEASATVSGVCACGDMMWLHFPATQPQKQVPQPIVSVSLSKERYIVQVTHRFCTPQVMVCIGCIKGIQQHSH